jgi:hypothetical protein
MKPNQQQLETIEDLLGSISKYRETYEELYDHILSALEAMPEEAVFADALYSIMENELGGKCGITNIESKYRRTAIKEIAMKYFQNFGRYLTSPFIVVVTTLTMLLYKAIEGNMINMQSIATLSFATNVVLIKIIRKKLIVKARNNGTYGKSSIISIIYPWLGMLPMWLALGCNLIYSLITFFVPLPQDSILLYINLGVFFINLVNMLAYYSLLKDEFKAINTN